MSAVRRRSPVKTLVLLLLLAVLGSAGYLEWRQSIGGPVLVTRPPRLLGQTTTFPVTLEARRGNVVVAEISVAQDGRSAVVGKVDGPPRPRMQVPVTVDAAALALREGEATVVVRARDDVWRPLASDEPPRATFPVVLDLTPPRLQVLATTRYVVNGGTGLVVFTADGAASTEVVVGDLRLPSFPVAPPERNARVALVPLPWDLAPGASVAVRARDEAGNPAARTVPFELKRRQFPHDTIDLTDALLASKVPELLPEHPPGAPLLEGFLAINRDQRRRAEEEKRRIAATTADRPLWEGAFVQPRNTKVFANFAETRTYRYQGREVDTQVHLGYDLASTRQAPVPAANRGIVAFTGPLTIYGNTVVIDHGLGLQTLYAHLSAVTVRAGDAVEKGQEIGRTGTTGLALADHLHYEVLVHGIAVTPLEWWDPQWVRDRIDEPLAAAGLSEVPGLAGPAGNPAPRLGRPDRRPPRRHGAPGHANGGPHRASPRRGDAGTCAVTSTLLGVLPTVNAALNGASAVLLVVGFVFIRRGRLRAHVACMLAAFGTSVVFLASYLTLRYFTGFTPFTGQGWIRPVYFTVLISHTVLTATVPALALTLLYLGFRAEFAQHRRIARWALPVWLYVSITGVVVYILLYQLYPGR